MVKKILKSYDYSLIIAVILLCAFGLIMVYSASMATAEQRYGVQSDYFYQKQKMWLSCFAVIFLFTAIAPYKMMQFKKFLIVTVVSSIAALFGVLVFGHVAGNAESWYQFGSIKIQPSEFVKLAVIIYLSAVYAKKQDYINQFNKGILPPLIFLFIVCGLIAIQPDFGTALVVALIASTILLCSGLNLKNVAKLLVAALVVLTPILLVMQHFIFTEKRMSRFAILGNPFAAKYVNGAGFHLANSLIAIGSGGINGLGLGKSIQKLGFLPESHTDFIMAVIAEELGIWGVGFVVLLIGYIVLRGIYIGLQCKDPFGSLLAFGVSGLIGIQTFINLAGVSGILPLIGVPLPFISYGGSSLLTLAAATGILVNVSMFVNYEKKYKNQKEQVNNKLHQRDGKVYYL
ncbi:FtsW/RodA/SpoVE family cell cycle protein [Bacillus sp. BRMEA1]|uniref:FtsW/RodA/SpoVE family cell cycle protein n=1 Tax=Neobacillus endophyticus TaxID=2738405 RepID=UPI001564C808|nr:FtsW/RodA/SpoVE family cell cycle protein [Neobacillus endophyticus]NRD78740.1 FtsW/RodA/SpoVE family cell cycle protein [Neobacillus endophyticus]